MMSSLVFGNALPPNWCHARFIKGPEIVRGLNNKLLFIKGVKI